MALMVLYAEPNVKIDDHTIAIQESAELAVKITKRIFKVDFNSIFILSILKFNFSDDSRS